MGSFFTPQQIKEPIAFLSIFLLQFLNQFCKFLQSILRESNVCNVVEKGYQEGYQESYQEGN